MAHYRRFEPHCHTWYSNIRLLDSINSPKALVQRGIEIGLNGIAITDHECVSASVELNQLQADISKTNPDFKIILGNEIYLVNERVSGQKYYHGILLAKDEIGHKQIRILSTYAWLNSYHDRGMERVPTLKQELYDIVKMNPGHLIFTTACLGGELSSLILEMESARVTGDVRTEKEAYEKICGFIQFMLDLFGKDFYIEIAPAVNKEQIIANKKLVQIAKLYNIGVVIGSDAHYLRKEDRYVHKAYLNSKGGEREVDAFYEYAYLQNEEEILQHLEPSFGDSAEEIYVAACLSSMEIYDKCKTYSLLHNQEIPSVEVKNYDKRFYDETTEQAKRYPVLTQLYQSDDIYDRYWVNECIDKLHELDKANDDYISRLEEEAKVKAIISQKLGTNMFKYPITLQHYIDLMWKCDSTIGAGRGSSCSGLNHDLLGVTQLDPLEWDLPFWRYLNEERIELGDIDIDMSPSKRPKIIHEIKDERGANLKIDNIPDYMLEAFKKELGCTLIATFGTETTKSAILTACRGYRSDDCPDGIDNDIAQYLSSLIPQERGFLWTLKDVVYGNEEKERKPVTIFLNKVNEYPGLLNIMEGIEGIISRRGSHASGVILFDEDPFEHCCFMKTPSGDVITQYDLHKAEAAGNTKYDFLVTEIQDKIMVCIKLMQADGVLPQDMTLREIYDTYLHPDVIPLDDERIWDAIVNGKVINLFQFDSDVGSQAAKKIAPSNIHELTDANGLMRLMTSEKGDETPMEKYVRFKNNIDLWYEEMDKEGLTKAEMTYLEPYFKQSYGVPPSQEQLMKMLMDENICNFTLAEANAARKIVGKKQMSKIPELQKKVLFQASSPALGKYVWKYGVGPQMGYAFSVIHALAYSFIAVQTAYLATNWNPIYWNCACLIVNSGSLEDDDNIEVEEDEDGEVVKKKEKGTDYAKMAKAISEIISQGISVSLVNINTSDLGFKPDVANNRILYGLKALSNISTEVIEKIKCGRPYSGIKDFMARCDLTKTATINLIKAGAFDEIDQDFSSRKEIMVYYLMNNCDLKKRLTLQNFNGLIQHNLIPKDLELQVRVYNFTKFLKAHRKVGKYYTFDNSCLEFYQRFLIDEIDKLEVINGVPCIKQDTWDKIYQKMMDAARDYIKENQVAMLKEYNAMLFKEAWDKYASGNTSHWEMESLCFYHGEHELAKVDMNRYGITDFFKLNPLSDVDYFFKRNGVQIPIFKLSRIVGTVLAKNDNKSTVTLLTTTGVVTVKFTREYYAMFKRQISEIQEDGTKKVKEKGWFSRGNMLMITGFRRDDMFVAKTYANTQTHQLYRITNVNGSEITLQHERYTSSTASEEDYE